MSRMYCDLLRVTQQGGAITLGSTKKVNAVMHVPTCFIDDSQYPVSEYSLSVESL
jgi:hypothetical protein